MSLAVKELVTVQKPVKTKEPLAIQPRISQDKPPVENVQGTRLRRFSLDEYQQLIELAFFDEDERIELLDGLLVEMSPINPRHAVCVDKLSGLINHLLYKKAWIRVQAPITLEGRSSQPQPDLVVALLQPEMYEERHVKAEETLLLIEVADSSLSTDQGDKLKLYASGGISEYWIINLVDNQLEVYQEPYLSATGEGNYKVKRTYTRDETVSLQAFPDCQLDLSEVLPRSITER